jgi:asparagine synthase (glutamine-hydrolysing)
MCGIAGILHFDPRERVDRDLLERMTRVLEHRGPDDEGFYQDGPVGLGHRRLSIIDLSGGAQPMANEDETVWIVFNGEIFNFEELREDLEKAGHQFRTRSDTECIVHLYEEHGPEECARRLVGQFAFAIWDSTRRRLFLARDHVGIKPLFYRWSDDGLIFASELKAILEDPQVPRDLDTGALLDYLSYRYVPAPKTIFQGIRKLPAGHWLVWQDGRMKVGRFWEMPPPGTGKPSELSEEEHARKLQDLLRESVRGQLMSDVPLGAFLSGGIDSSIIVGFMAELMDQPVKTFTIGFREADFSEVDHARRIAGQHRTEHRELIVEPDSVDLLPRIVRQFDEPFADPSAIPTYHVCRMAREHVTVCLSGDGGDEGFAGYRRYQWALKFSGMDWLPAGLRSAAFGALEKVLPRSRYKTAARRFALHPALRYADVFSYFGRTARSRLLSGDLRRIGNEGEEFALLRELHDRAAPADDLSRLQYMDILSYLPDDILVKTDRMSMLNSLEVRVPLLDHRVLEYAATVPSELRLGKRILKKAAGHLLPADLLSRPKMGFGVPLKHWFKDDWRGYAGDLLSSRRAAERGFFDVGEVKAMVEARAGAGGADTQTVYALVVFEEWCRQYLDVPSPA